MPWLWSLPCREGAGEWGKIAGESTRGAGDAARAPGPKGELLAGELMALEGECAYMRLALFEWEWPPACRGS